MTAELANESELYFTRGGPIYRFFQRIRPAHADEHPLRYRILGFLCITWVPLLILALIEHRALGATPKLSLLLDIGTYARFFIAIPLLIVAERLIGPRLTGAALHFVRGGYVTEQNYPAFDRAIARAAKRRESGWAEAILLALAITGAWFFTTESLHGESETWRDATRADGGVSFTGLWYHAIAVPILQFFWYRWLWRLFNWVRFLWDVSRLDLNLVATHADQAGGLGFLANAQSSFGVLGFSVSAILSGEVAFLLLHENAAIETFKMPFITLLVIIEILFLGPLLIFSPLLMKTRLAWLRTYSLLVVRYNRAFHTKWIDGGASPDEPLLGSADIQSLADLGGSFEYVKNMKVVVFTPRVIVQMAIITSLPAVPLLLLVMPVGKLLDLFAGAVL